MIHLTSLRADGFKQLRGIDLTFPPRFCTLIEGPNEAGKSTIFEAIYFALYGQGLYLRGGGRGRTSSLIGHQNPSAEVQLGLHVNDTHLTITRKITQRRNEAEVLIITPGNEEKVRGISDVNKEILARLNYLDGEALLSSCFVQQKKLGQLEDLTRADRQNILLKLLDMERLTRLKGCFRWGMENERLLNMSRDKLRLTGIVKETADLRLRLQQIERRLLISRLRAELEARTVQEQLMREARERETKHKLEVEKLTSLIEQIEALDEMLEILKDISEARRHISLREDNRKAVVAELKNIARLESEALSVLQCQYGEIGQLNTRIISLATLESKHQELSARAEQLELIIKQEETLAGPRAALARHSAERDIVTQNVSRAREVFEVAKSHETLMAEAADLADKINNYEAKQERLTSNLARTREMGRRTAELERLSSELEEVRAATSVERDELEAAKEAHKQISQAQVLRRWAVISRDAQEQTRVAETVLALQSQIKAARTRQDQAVAEEHIGTRMLLFGSALVTTGIIFTVIGIWSAWLLITGLIGAVAGLLIVARGWSHNRRAITKRRGAESEATQLEREAHGEEVRYKTLSRQMESQLVEVRRALHDLGLSEPESVATAEQQADTLDCKRNQDLLPLIVGKEETIRAAENRERQLDLALAQQQQALLTEGEELRRNLASDDARNPEEAEDIITRIEEELNVLRMSKKRLEEEAMLIVKIFPPNQLLTDFEAQLNQANADLQKIELELEGKRSRISTVEESINRQLEAAGLPDITAAQTALAEAQAGERDLYLQISAAWQADEDLLSRLKIPSQTRIAQTVLAQIQAELNSEVRNIQEVIAKRPNYETDLARLNDEIEIHSRRIEEWWQQLSASAPRAHLNSEASTPAIAPEAEAQLFEKVHLHLGQHDLGQLRHRKQQELDAQATERAKVGQAEDQAEIHLETARKVVQQLGIDEITEVNDVSLSARLPDFNEVEATDILFIQSESSDVTAQLLSLDREAKNLETELQLNREALDYETTRNEVETLQRRQTICRQAAPILDEVRENILRAVLPSTLDYMSALLPLLTCGRYHFAELDDDTYKIRVFDNRAGDYIEKEIFSGATQDQFSLALRLAFALATLPQGLGAQPKFIFLDEPTAGFDGERRKAFIRLLTEEELAERFDQIFLASPEGIFDTNPLPHYVRVSGGKVVDENLSTSVQV